MILALAGVGLGLLVLPGLAVPWVAARVPPRDWTRIVVASLLFGVAALLVALALAAVPAAANAVSAPGIVDHCRGALAPLASDPTMLSWVAGGLLLAMGIAFARGAWRSMRVAHRARIEPWLGHHEARPGFDLVVVPTAELVAFGVPGAPPQVIVSQGLIDHFDEAEMTAIVEHEVAHHRLCHWRYLVAMAGVQRACGWLPLVNRGVDSARASMESWADEESGTVHHQHRETLRRALAGMSVPTGRIRDRMRRLAGPPAADRHLVRIVIYAPLVVGILTLAVLVVGWFSEAHHAMALGDPCSH